MGGVEGEDEAGVVTNITRRLLPCRSCRISSPQLVEAARQAATRHATAICPVEIVKAGGAPFFGHFEMPGRFF